MKFELTHVTALVDTDFLYIKNKDEIKNLDLETRQERWIFAQDGSEEMQAIHLNTYRTLLTYHVPITDMPWQDVGVIEVGDHWDIIRSKSSHKDLVFVMEEGKPVGYVHVKTLFNYVLETYTYLKAYYDAILDTTEGSISAINEDKKTVVWTRGAEKIFSVKREDIIGKPMDDFFPKKMLECFHTLSTGKPVYRKQHQPREDLFVLVNSNPVRLGGEIVGAVVAEMDVTYQLQLNKELSNANRTISHLRQEVSKMSPSQDPFYTIKGSSTKIQKTIEKIKQVGSTEARVLILGESGVGKELFAKALHDVRESEDAPFIAVNCGAIPPSLFESELFGYEKGAFSGADSRGKKGKIDLAKGGTLFLDEVGDLPFDMQVKLLRVLQENKYYRVGGTKQQQTECRIIAATNKDLNQLVQGGQFRDDLYYRLNNISIRIPPLRERIEDVVELSHMFLYEYASRYHRKIDEIPKDIMFALLNYHWPGNIRELRSAIERLVVFAKNDTLDITDLPFEPSIDDEMSRSYSFQLTPNQRHSAMTLNKQLQLYEKKLIERAIQSAQGNKLVAAKNLGVSRATLYNKMNKLRIKK